MIGSEHRYTRRRLDRFVDDELRGPEVDAVTAHLIECPHCSAAVRLLLRIRASLQHVVARRPADIL